MADVRLQNHWFIARQVGRRDRLLGSRRRERERWNVERPDTSQWRELALNFEL